MKASKKLLGMPVISLESGEQIGVVKGFIVDSKAIKIAALVLEQKGGWFKDARIITFEHIKNVGEHAITVEITRCIQKASSLPQIMALSKHAIEIIGTKVISQEGNLLGTVEEFFFEPVTGNIIVLEISGRLFDSLFKGKAFLNAAYIQTLGKHAIIVTRDAEDKLERQESGFHEKVKNIKETSNKVWSSTLETTKRLGETLSKSIEKFTVDEEESEELLEEKEKPLPDIVPLSEEAEVTEDNLSKSQ